MRDPLNTPPPGSPRALMQGCTCAQIDNHYGRGYQGRSGIFMITGGCPLHDPKQEDDDLNALADARQDGPFVPIELKDLP